MTCVELQESLIENDSGGTAAQRAHLRDCPHCAGLVADLLVIACAAGELRAAHEPGPHVWNSIETSLRREGIIKPFARRSLLPSLTGSWSWTGWFTLIHGASRSGISAVTFSGSTRTTLITGICIFTSSPSETSRFWM